VTTRAGREVTGVNQGRAQTALRGIACHTGASDAAADYEQVNGAGLHGRQVSPSGLKREGAIH
jgi:hypothetical protein